MAPRKSVDKTSALTKNTEGKPKKPRKEKIKKEKPKLKIPTVVKVKITKRPRQPGPGSSPKPAASKSKLSKAENAAIRKIEMANEVALAALSKSPVLETDALKKEPVEETSVTTCDVTSFENRVVKPTLVRPKKRGRPKRQSIVDTATEVVEDNTNIPVSPPKKKKKVTGVKSKKKSDNNGNLNEVAPPKKKVNTKPVKATKKVTANGAPSKQKADSTTKQLNIAGPKSKKKKPIERTQCKCNTGIKRKYTRKGKNAGFDDMSASEHKNSPSVLEHTPFKDKELDSLTIKSPSLIESRKTSMTSVSECLSWTKDISSSSTTTTCLSVSSRDIVRIDKKLPVLRLADISRDLKSSAHPADEPAVKDIAEETPAPDKETESAVKDTIPSSSSSSSNSSSSSSSSDNSPRSLDLSSSSPTKSLSTVNTHDFENYKYASEKVQSLIKKLDFEIITWIGQDENTDPNITKLVEKGLKMLKEEKHILALCKDLKSFLSDEPTEKPIDKDRPVENENANKDANKEIEKPESCPGNITDKSEEDENFLTTNSRNVMLDQHCENIEDPLLEEVGDKIVNSGHSSDETFTSDRVKYTSFDASYNDDDDALSIYAESISGMESSRLVSSAPSLCASEPDFEEYVPQRITDEPILEFSYYPSRIEEERELEGQNETTTNLKYRTVCEKQNADSTSIHKEPESINRQINIANSGAETPDRNIVVTFSKHIPPPALKVNVQRKRLMASFYPPMNAVKSIIFKGVCFFNLISNCKKARCIFPHVKLDIIEIQNRLGKISEEYFVQEYMLMRNFPILRQVYGIYFVQECQRRELTRILVEMSIDFIMKAKDNSAEDKALKVFVTEQAMLHLTNVDLNVCDDLLLYVVGQNKQLCDVYMETLAETLNFSRFKQIFTKLAEFVVKHAKLFDSTVVTKILERVCILPYEELIAKTLILMIKNTDENIFNMITQFERYLLANGAQELYDDVLACRNRISKQSNITNLYNSPSGRVTQDMDMSIAQAENERYTSPDTTKLDTMNKPVVEPIITRTMNGIRPMFNPNFNSPSSSESEEYKRQPNKTKFKQWRPQNPHTFMNSPLRFPRPLIKRPMPIMKRHLDQRMFGPSQPKFPRRPGPGMDPY